MGFFDWFRRKPLTKRDLAIREAVSRYEKRFTENFDYYQTLADPYEYYRDYGGNFLPAGVALSDRAKGRINQLVLSEGQLRIYRGMSRWILESNPYAIGIVTNLRNFVVRRGFTFSPDAEADAGVKVRQQYVVDRYTKLDNWIKRQQEFFWRALRDGEVFLLRGRYQNGWTMARFIEPEFVRNPPSAGPDWQYGIQKDAKDNETPLAYYVCDPENEHEGQIVSASQVLHYKRNVDASISRGLSDLFPLRDDFEGVDRLLRNTREGAAVQAAIAMVREHSQASADTVGDFISGRREYQRMNPITGRQVDYERLEPGSIVDIPQAMKFQPPPSSANLPAYVQVIQACVRAILTRWCAPEFLSGDASNANYASTLVSGSPFIEHIKTEQAELGECFKAILGWVAEDAYSLGILKDEDLATELQCEPPEPTMTNHLEQEQIFQMRFQSKVMSAQTWQQKVGLDPEQEQDNITEWEATNGPAMPPLDLGGGPQLPTPGAGA